jgi:hypothetical protein
MRFGPWRPEIDATERVAQLRCLAGLAAVFRGCHDPLVAALREAEHDAAALARASELLERLPALVKRKLLSTFGSVTWPARPKANAIDRIDTP